MRLHYGPRSVAASLTMLVVASLGSIPANAEGPGKLKESDRWSPSLSVTLALTIQDVEGFVESFDALSGVQLRPTSEGDKVMLSPQGGGTLEIMSPTLPIPLGPRIFFDGEVWTVSNQRRRAAREGDPSGLEEPEGRSFTAGAILGQGSTTTIDLENVAYGAGIGIAFPVQIGDYKLLIKPAARYLRRSYKNQGAVLHAFRIIATGPTREVNLRGREDFAVDAIGPSLEIEVEALGVGTLRSSVFANVAAFRILGNHNVAFSTTAQDSLGAETFTANWIADVNPWIYRAGVGMRLRWSGLPAGWLGTRRH
jgi:hypothetical protein